MSAPDFRDVLDYLCGEIRSTQEREEVEAELHDHLMTHYEINCATGMTPEEAEESAVQSLGDLELVHKRLLKLHRRDPIKTVNSAFLWFGFSFSFLLYLLSVDFVLYDADQVRKLSFYSVYFSLCFLVPLFMMRTAALRAAVGSVAVAASGAVFGGLMPYLSAYSDNLNAALFCIWISLFCMGVLLLLDSLRKAVRDAAPDSVNRLFVAAMAVLPLYCLLAAIQRVISLRINGIVLSLQAAIKYGAFGNSSLYLLVFLSCKTLGIAAMVLGICCLVFACRACKLAPQKTLQFREISLKSAILIVILFAVSIYVPHIVYINRPPMAQTVEETDVLSAQEEARIRGVLSTYGIPEATLALLPDSELALYATAKEYVPDEADFRDYVKRCPDGEYPLQEEYNDLAFHEYAVVLSEGKDAFTVRILYHLDYRENDPHSYRRRLEIRPRGAASANALTSYGQILPSDSDPAFLRIRYLRGDTACDCKPFYFQEKSFARGSVQSIIEYAERGCADLIFAATYRVTTSPLDPIVHFGCDFICKRFVRPVQLWPKLMSESKFGEGAAASGSIYDRRYLNGAATQTKETSYHCWKSPDLRNGGVFFTEEN